MTRKEAIAVLECLALEMNAILAGIHKSEATADQIKRCIDAYDMAISALRQQEQLDKVSQGSSQDKQLTLDELRQMDGEPVYCVDITGREEWLFRRYGGFADMYGEWTSDDFMSWDNYGKLWWCYSQKPEEGTV